MYEEESAITSENEFEEDDDDIQITRQESFLEIDVENIDVEEEK
jgi:hypothetical protein